MNPKVDIGNGFSLSLQNSSTHYCTPGSTVELAIFKDDEWYCKDTGIPSLEYKADSEPGQGTRVFGHTTKEEVLELVLKLTGRRLSSTAFIGLAQLSQVS